MCNQGDKENSGYENFDNVVANPLMLFNCSSKEGRLQELYKLPESDNILLSTSVFQNKLPLITLPDIFDFFFITAVKTPNLG
jgi:hypothetical protein